MRRPGVRHVAVACPLLLGCAADFGGGMFHQVRDSHAVGAAQIAASTKIGTPLNNQGFLVGAEVRGRAEDELGSRWMAGLRAGYGQSPDPAPGKMGWELHGDFGTPLGKGGLFPDWSIYAGATFATPIWMSRRHEGSDLNTSSWFFKRAVELVPSLSARVYLDRLDDGPTQRRTDLGVGLAVRLRAVNDFL